MRRILAAVAASAVIAFPAAAQSAPAKPTTATTASADIKPGVYEISIVMGGGTIDGTITLTQRGDSLDTKMHVGDHDTPITRVVRKGSHLAVTGGGGGMLVMYELDFKGDAVTGTMNFNGDAGTVSGKRRAAGR